jgi:hypothetical protein
VSALAIAAVAAFNLICAGRERVSELEDGTFITKSRSEYRSSYRIDLNNNRWCSGNCTETSTIKSTTVRSIRLVDAKEPLEALLDLNRETGEMIYRMRIGNVVTLRMGQCERSEFTGFPTPKF